MILFNIDFVLDNVWRRQLDNVDSSSSQHGRQLWVSLLPGGGQVGHFGYSSFQVPEFAKAHQHYLSVIVFR